MLSKPGKKYQGYFEKDKKHGYGIYLVGKEENAGKSKLVGKFVENQMEGLAFQYIGNELQKYLFMERNKVRKQLNKEEIAKIKKTEEYMNLMIFIDEASLRGNIQLL